MNLVFPVFAFKERDKKIYIFMNEQDLTNTNTELLNKKVLDGVSLVDSQGKQCRITGVKFKRYTALFGFSLFKKGRQVEVEFEFATDKSQVTLFQFKEILLKKIKEDRDYWKSVWILEDLYEKVHGALTFNEIAKLMK